MSGHIKSVLGPCLLALHFCVLGCSVHGIRINAKYVDTNTGGSVVLHHDGRFFYSLVSANPTVSNDGLPVNSGYYHIDKGDPLKPIVTVRSVHAGFLDLRLSQDYKTLFIRAPGVFDGERAYAKTK